MRKARLASDMKNSRQSIEATSRLIDLLTGMKDPFYRNRLVLAHLHRAQELDHFGQVIEGFKAYDVLVEQFGFGEDPGIEEYVATPCTQLLHFENVRLATQPF